MHKTRIEYADFTANPIKAKRLSDGKVGHFCVKISDGCKNCYSEKYNHRNLPYCGTGLDYTQKNLDKIEWYWDEKEAEELVRSNRISGKMVFLCDMTDWMLAPVWMRNWLLSICALRPDVIFLLLTKRVKEQMEYLSDPDLFGAILNTYPILVSNGVITPECLNNASEYWASKDPDGAGFITNPIQNIRYGVSVESAKYKFRLEHLRATPAAFRWVSFEPAVADFDLVPHDLLDIDWAVFGGESSSKSKARDCHTMWLLKGAMEARVAGCKAYIKQLGSKPIHNGEPLKLKDKKGGDINEWPAKLQIRELPPI